MRLKLVDEIQTKGITDIEVLRAIGAVPRHLFLDSAYYHLAYKDQAMPIDMDQTISQPYTVAYQTQLLSLKPQMKVLEIGTGSGYQAAILAELNMHVFSIERIEKLYLKASNKLKELGYNMIHTYLGDGYQGLKTEAPFDRIIVTAAAPYIPESLKQQLVIGGILVIPVGAGDSQSMLRIQRHTLDVWEENTYDPFRFVPLLGGIHSVN